MKLKALLLILLVHFFTMKSQHVMTPEIMWKLRKISVQAVSSQKEVLIYKLSQMDLATEKNNSLYYLLTIKNGNITPLDLGKKSILQWDKNGIYAMEDNQLYLSKDQGKSWEKLYTISDAENIKISPDGKKIVFSKEVLVEKILAKDKYQDTPNSTAHIYTDLNHRHWDYFSSGKYNHVFYVDLSKDANTAKDLMEGEKWDSPQRPFGGGEDFIWTPDSNGIIYVTKPLSGAEYAKSTNTDLFLFDINSGKTKNLTQENNGYDVAPKFSSDGKYLFWQSMEKDGYESDKNDIKLMDWSNGKIQNLTSNWDETVTGDTFWDSDSGKILFTAAYRGTNQLFSVDPKNNTVTQISKGDFDINDVITTTSNQIIVTRTDINHTTDLFTANKMDGNLKQLTNVNKDIYATITTGKSELKLVKTSDGKDMGVWFHYPPDFDPTKKYPALLYCQGGPQSALTQFFSTRWNFALMAAQGYIVIAPNRRGMPGWGTKWNQEISQDWGGQPIRDYLAATDFAKNLPFVDKDRIGAVGASYGGYSVYMLAGVHNKRFKTFIAHDGLFDVKSWSLTTEELWFANWDIGSPFQKPLPKAFTDYNPINFVEKWDTPIMIVQGGIDYRVPYEQGQEAFQAAKLKNLKAKFLYFPNENHWVLHPQNSIVWHREFFAWLKETL